MVLKNPNNKAYATDEWRGEEDGAQFALYVEYDKNGHVMCTKEIMEELLKKAGLYKYEENI